MKKLLAIILAVAMLFTLALTFTACEKKDDSGNSSGGASTPAGTGDLIGVVMPTKSLERWNTDGERVKSELEALGYQVDLQFSDNKVADQVSQIENLITKKVKVLIIASVDGSALSEPLAAAAAEGIKVIAYDRLIMNTENVDAYCTFDNVGVGEMQANFIVKALDLENKAGPFNIEFFAGSPDDNNAKLFNEGAMSVLQPFLDSGKLKCLSGDVEYSKIGINEWKTETAQARMENLLTANYTSAKIDAVLSPNDSLAKGIINALEAVDYKVGDANKPMPVVTGQDADKGNADILIAGKQSMSILKDLRILAKEAAKMADAFVKGETPTTNGTYNNDKKEVPSLKCELLEVTKDNYKEVLIDSEYYTADEYK